MRKILFYNDSADFGGAERYLISVVKGFTLRGYKTVLVTVRSASLQRYKEELRGTEIIAIPRLSGFFAMSRAIAQTRPDAVFLNFAYPSANFLAAIAAKTAKVPKIVGAIHFTEPVTSRFPFGSLVKRLITRIVFPLLDKVIISSERCKAQLEHSYNIPSGKIAVVHNGIDLDCFSVAPDSCQKNDSGKSPRAIIGMVGRVVKGKGHEVFVKAAAEVLCAGLDAEFLVVGEGPLLNTVKKLAADLNISANVTFSGYQSRLNDFIAKMDIAVLPSLHETFPYVLLEYMAMAKPVIATDVGGVPEMIEDGKTGLVIPQGDSRALAGAIISLISDSGSLTRMGMNGRKRVENSFTTDRMIDNTVKAIGWA